MFTVQFKMRKEFYWIIILFLTLLNLSAFSQAKTDSIVISIDTAEKQFLEKNLSLIASHYSIDVNKALIFQARLWSNPNFQIGQGAYNTASHKFFELSGVNSIQSAQIQQLFLLAGKRNKQIKIAATNLQISEYSFFDLIRTLKAQLRGDFYSIYYLQKSVKVYDEEINSLSKIAKVFSQQVVNGNISKKEEIRIRSQLFSLQNEFVLLKQQIIGYQSDLNLLLQSHNIYYFPVLDTSKSQDLNFNRLTIAQLVDTALTYRYDLKISEADVTMGQQNLALQKALAFPDVSLGLSYASNGSAAPNYFQLFAGIDLPFFNRNQGNIKSSQFLLQQNIALLKNQKLTVENEVYKTYAIILQNQLVFKDYTPQFLLDFNRLIKEVFKNYQNRNISLLEFLDFYDSYKQNTLQSNILALNQINAIEQLNFVVGRDLHW